MKVNVPVCGNSDFLRFLAPVLFFLSSLSWFYDYGIHYKFLNYSMTKFEFQASDNYIRMFKDPVFVKSLINTAILVIGSNLICGSLLSLFGSISQTLSSKCHCPVLSIVSSSSPSCSYRCVKP